MKKVLVVFAVFFTAVSLFLIVSRANAVTEIDSTCTANTMGWLSVNRSGGLTQYFKPVKNHLTKMQMVVRDESAGTYRLSLKKEGTTLVTQDFSGSGGGTQIYQVIDGFDVEVIPGDWYQIQMDRISGNYGWYYTSNTNCYAEGYAYYDSAQQSKDFWFYTWGYTSSTPTTTSETTTASSSESTSAATSSPESTAITTNSSSNVNVDKSIIKPALTYIEKNKEKINAPITQEITVTEKDTLKIAGTSFADAKEIKVFAGDKEFTAQVDKNGDWTADVKLSEVKDGTYQVQAQAKNKLDKYSQKADLFKLKKENTKVSPISVNASQNQSFWQKLFTEYVYYTTVILILVLASVAIAVYYLIKKKKQEVK